MNRILKLLLFIIYLWFISDGLLGPLYAVYSEKIGGSVLDIAISWSIYMIVSGILHFIFGSLADKLNKVKEFLALGFLIATIGAIGYIFITDTIGLSIIQVILGIANALGSSTWDGLFSRNIKKNNHATMWSLYEGGYSILVGISAIIGGLIVLHAGWITLFIIMAILDAIGFCIIFIMNENAEYYMID